MFTPGLRPRCCLCHALQQGLYRLGQLLRAAFVDACRHGVGTSAAVVTETSNHSHALLHRRAGDGRLEHKALGTLCVGVAAQTRKLALSRKSYSEKVSLALRIQCPALHARVGREHALSIGHR